MASYKELARETTKCFVINKTTVRGVAKLTGVAKSTVYERIVRFIDDCHTNPADELLARQAEELITKNKKERHIRGGKASAKKIADKKKQNLK